MNSAGFFLYRWIAAIGGDERDYAVAYRSPGYVDRASYADLFEEALKGPLVPDALILLYTSADSEVVMADLNSSVAMNAALRFNDRLPLVLACLEPRPFTLSVSVRNDDPGIDPLIWTDRLNKRLDDLLMAGLQQIFSPADILIEAPPGFQFAKPSKRGHKFFIRSEQGLHSSGRASFVALAVLRRLVHSCQIDQRSPTAIFVDTMGIASVAFCVKELLAHTGLGEHAQIESFHSYRGIRDARVSDPQRTLCLISASTSMAMHRDWVNLKGGSSSSVVTLATFAGSTDCEHSLVALDMPVTGHESDEVPYRIQITGETFVPIFEAAKQILLKKKHKGTLDFSALRELHATGQVLGVFGSASVSGRPKGIFVRGRPFIESSGGIDSVVQRIEEVGFGTSLRLIYQCDEDSKWFAEAVAMRLKATELSLAPEVLSAAAVRSLAKFDDKVIVVAAVVGNGSQLNDISRDLRPIHSGDRLYLIGCQFATTQHRLDIFKRNLALRQIQEQPSKPYAVLTMHAFAFGDELSDSFQREQKAAFNQDGRPIPEQLRARLDLMRMSRNSAMGLGLLPCGRDLDQSLRLRPNFSFWSPNYPEAENQATVLATVAAVLQNAREDDSLADSDKLSSRILGQVRLDPENFASRFNDGVVQAAILRSARPHEIDYRDDSDCSIYFGKFLDRMLRRLDDPSSEAILEFLSAIATKKLQLNETATKMVVESASQASSNMADCALGRALAFYGAGIAVACLGSPDTEQSF